jgi:hypothetical protein
LNISELNGAAGTLLFELSERSVGNGTGKLSELPLNSLVINALLF